MLWLIYHFLLLSVLVCVSSGPASEIVAMASMSTASYVISLCDQMPKYLVWSFVFASLVCFLCMLVFLPSLSLSISSDLYLECKLVPRMSTSLCLSLDAVFKEVLEHLLFLGRCPCFHCLTYNRRKITPQGFFLIPERQVCMSVFTLYGWYCQFTSDMCMLQL